MMKKVFLDDLPKKEGIGVLKGKQVIDWKKSIGYKVKFIYEDIEGKIEIIDYQSKGQNLFVKYLDMEIYKTKTSDFIKCRLGKYLGKITSEFRVEIGLSFKDEKRDLIIIDKEYRTKEKNNGKKQHYRYYKYKCHKCGHEDWIQEYHLISGESCTCCTGRTVVEGINTIWDTDRWMCDLGVSEEDAKKYTHGSAKKISIICPICGNKRNNTIHKIYTNRSIGCPCGDGFSYPEKIMHGILKQLNIEFITQLNKSVLSWCENYKYDFYIPSLNLIIEMHGEQHYRQSGFVNHGGKTLEQEQLNDKLKEQLAKDDNVKYYIVINCMKAQLEFIKENIINSELNILFNLNDIIWSEVESFALNNLCKLVCEFKNSHNNLTSSDISRIMNLSRTTVIKYLKMGNKLDWVNYNPIKEKKLGSQKLCKEIEIYKDGILLGEFNGCSELSKQSKELFGVELKAKSISNACKDEKKSLKGFTFKYI